MPRDVTHTPPHTHTPTQTWNDVQFNRGFLKTLKNEVLMVQCQADSAISGSKGLVLVSRCFHPQKDIGH